MPWNRKVAFGSPLSPLIKAKLPSGLALLEHGLGHQAANADVVKGHIERVRIFHEHVIGQASSRRHRDAALNDGRMASLVVGNDQNHIDFL